MKKGYQIVKPVLEKFRGLPERLHRLFGKSDDYYRSQGYPTRKMDAIHNGSLSAVDHLLRMADEYEAAAPGAGKLLGELLSTELSARFVPEPDGACDDRVLRRNLYTEFFDALNELDKKDLSDQSVIELARTESELAQVETVIGYAISNVRAEIKRKGAKNYEKRTNA